MKKILKRLSYSLLILAVLLVATPYLFQSQIKDMIRNYINDNVNANVTFVDVDLSFLKSFPKAHVTIDNLTITNYTPFEGDTLASIKSATFNMSIKELFKSEDDDAIVVDAIIIDGAALLIKSDINGDTNYNIAKPKDSSSPKTEDDSTSKFKLNIDHYSITNSSLNYSDAISKTVFQLHNLNHSGTGKFSNNQSELDTKTNANISLSIDNSNYLNNLSIKLDALIGLNLAENIYTFKKNEGYINQLPLEFDGYVKLLEIGQDIDISFRNPESSFKDFLALVPEQYSKNLDQVETSGDFKVNGEIKGLITETSIPTLDINIISNNARFKYPELPKSVENIIINTSIKNTSGAIDDTFIAINNLNFKIDEDVFSASATLKNLTKNILVNANIDGTLNLANITKAYPVSLENDLSGILKGKLQTAFDMNAINTNAFQRIKNNGNVSLSDFTFASEDIINPIHISKADIKFNSSTVALQTFNATTGTSDFSATGSIQNLIGFLLSDKKLKGHFNVTSNRFVVSDFMVENESDLKENNTEETTEALKIPNFLDCTINANINTVVYDNLNLKDVKGSLIIKNQQATLNNMRSKIFNGGLSLSGSVSTKTEVPEFDLNLGADNFDISESFKNLDLLQNLAPIAKIFQGKLNSTLHLSGTLNEEYSPNLSSVSGTAIAELLTTDLNTNEASLFQNLSSALSFIDFDKLNLKDLKTHLDFENGKVTVKPFKLKYQDIEIEISGTHGFDKTVDYKAVFNVPAKYLGPDINNLIAKINDKQVNSITVPVTANITGTYSSPAVKTDLTSGITKLTQQLVEIEKQKLVTDGKNKVKDLLGGILDRNKTTNDSIKTDSTNTKNKVTKEIKNVLGGFLNKKKKKKDSINN